jgi:hypothetical protein
LWQASIKLGDTKRNDAAHRAARTLDAGNPGAQIIEDAGGRGGHFSLACG